MSNDVPRARGQQTSQVRRSRVAESGLRPGCGDDGVEIPESDRPVVQIPLGHDLIHAPTGAVLLQLRWLALEGRDDPVHHLEQPVFAWT